MGNGGRRSPAGCGCSDPLGSFMGDFSAGLRADDAASLPHEIQAFPKGSVTPDLGPGLLQKAQICIQPPPPPSPIPGSQGEDKRGLAEPGPSWFSLGSRALGVPCTMAWPLVCLLLLTCCSGSFSQPVLTQAPSMSASLGATVKLSCTLSSEYDDYGVTWHQQIPGKAPRYLMYVYSDGDVEKGEGVPDRFSGSSSGANRYLSINNIQAEDEADYYCGAGDGSGGYHSATFSEEVGQKPPCQPSPCPTAGPDF
ncbi:T-cell surface glycoprotein CD8 alpha chain-like [Antechinus flavipes]|uniref:T-cell surface glycoprotein CD8 alpha chain-like n=1 Tax=Antechinus flavipes TaxID=38775 RepID=UPI0022358935|nr:T-cell surface glycoprotein CD8 alpha chain-like [Antechinus flavipes]